MPDPAAGVRLSPMHCARRPATRPWSLTCRGLRHIVVIRDRRPAMSDRRRPLRKAGLPVDVGLRRMDHPPSTPHEESSARGLIHLVNNFLAVCMTHGEMALEADTAEAMRDALGEILDASRRMAESVEEARRELLQAAVCDEASDGNQPERSQETPVSPPGL